MRFKRRVLLTREREDIERDKEYFLKRGIGIVRMPLIKTILLSYSLPPEEPDYIVFQSKNAFRYFNNHLEKFPKAKIVAVGEKTGDFIKKAGFSVWLVPKEQNAVGICEAMKNERRGVVWIPRSKTGRVEVIDFLSKEGFQVFPINVYKTINIYYKIEIFLCRLLNVGAVLFASPSAVFGFFENLRMVRNIKNLDELLFIAIGKTTKKYLENYGVKIGYIPDKPNIEAISDYLAAFWHTS